MASGQVVSAEQAVEQLYRTLAAAPAIAVTDRQRSILESVHAALGLSSDQVSFRQVPVARGDDAQGDVKMTDARSVTTARNASVIDCIFVTTSAGAGVFVVNAQLLDTEYVHAQYGAVCNVRPPSVDGKDAKIEQVTL